MGWRRLSRYIRALEDQGDLIRVTHPVDCYLEAGCIADKLVKNDGPAVIFEKPRLADGTISELPLAMNLFGTRRRTNQALRVKKPDEIGLKLTELMKPDIGTFVKRPWKAWPLAKRALALPPKKFEREHVNKFACRIQMSPNCRFQPPGCMTEGRLSHCL